MKTLFLTFALLFTLGSCSDDENAVTPFAPVTITPVLIGKGFFSSEENLTPANLVAERHEDGNLRRRHMD